MGTRWNYKDKTRLFLGEASGSQLCVGLCWLEAVRPQAEVGLINMLGNRILLL